MPLALPPSLVDRRARLVVATMLASSLYAATLTACSLDWAVRSDPGAPPESGLDVADARPGNDSEAAASTDAEASIDGAECIALAAEVARTKAKARECQIASGQCTTTVKDECDCDVVIRLAGAATTMDYTNAIVALRMACGKPTTCANCPQLGQPGNWICLQKPSTKFECSP